MGSFRGIAAIALALIMPAALAQQSVAQPSPGLEVGVRYWLSSGSTTRSIDATAVDPTLIHPLAESALNPSATTNYEQLDANIVELFARKRIEDRYFVKGTVGLGKMNGGTLIDETFFIAGGEPVHTMTLSAVDGKLGYATLDIGRTLMQGRETAFGVFVGYHYWKEKLEAHGLSDAFGTLSLPPEDLFISNDITWHAVRLGGELRVTRGRTHFTLEAVWMPYAGYRNEATNHFATDPNVLATGNGRGGAIEAELRRSFPQLGGIDLGVGVRYWKLNAYNGNETNSGLTFPIVDLASERYGFMFTAAKRW